MIELGFRTLLANETTISSIVADRVMGMVLDINPVLPAITVQVISSVSGQNLNGVQDLQRMRVQVDCWGENYKDAVKLRGAVMKFLDDFVGTLPDGTYLQNAERVQQIDFFESLARHFRAMCEFNLYFTLPD